MASSAPLAIDARPRVFQELDAMRVRSGLSAEDFALLLQEYACEQVPESDGERIKRRTQSAPGMLTPRTDRSDSVPSVRSLDSPMGDSDTVLSLLETKETTKYDTFVYPSGSIEDFHKGLSERIGIPHLEFFEAMQQEHCKLAGADVEFTTRNYGIR